MRVWWAGRQLTFPLVRMYPGKDEVNRHQIALLTLTPSPGQKIRCSCISKASASRFRVWNLSLIELKKSVLKRHERQWRSPQKYAIMKDRVKPILQKNHQRRRRKLVWRGCIYIYIRDPAMCIVSTKYFIICHFRLYHASVKAWSFCSVSLFPLLCEQCASNTCLNKVYCCCRWHQWLPGYHTSLGKRVKQMNGSTAYKCLAWIQHLLGWHWHWVLLSMVAWVIHLWVWAPHVFHDLLRSRGGNDSFVWTELTATCIQPPALVFFTGYREQLPILVRWPTGREVHSQCSQKIK